MSHKLNYLKDPILTAEELYMQLLKEFKDLLGVDLDTNTWPKEWSPYSRHKFQECFVEAVGKVVCSKLDEFVVLENFEFTKECSSAICYYCNKNYADKGISCKDCRR